MRQSVRSVPPRRISGKLPSLLLLGVLLGSSVGCAGNRVGSQSTWGLCMQGNRTPTEHLVETARLLEGHNDFSDLARSAKLLSNGPEEGFGVIARDLRATFIGPFSWEELRSTFRLLE